MRLASLLLLVGLVLPCCSLIGAAPVHYDIGVVHRATSTDSATAQLWFDRGLALCFGFNHEEAVQCFDRAAQADPGFAMAHWGRAYALGPNYNSTVIDDVASQAAWEAIQRAQALKQGASAAEAALIDAMAQRYAWPAPEDRMPLERAYAEAMQEVYASYPDDPDVAALTAEALMQLKPWGLWSHEGVPAPILADIRHVLENGIARWPKHPALCHLYIHAMEAGPEVALAGEVAKTLEGLTPGLGHLIHMPSHIYVWTGRYADVIRVNVEAVDIDDAFVEHAGRENFYSAYRIHNYHFVAYGAMWDGQRALALEYARRLVDELPPGLLAAVPDVFDIFAATPYHVQVRFGLWEQILKEPEPAPELLATRAVWHYARGVALASLGKVEAALKEQDAFLAARAAVPASRMLFNNSVSGILAVAEKVLAGEIAYRQGAHERAFVLLREAVALDEVLNYDEPWGWMEPARHALGALLTEQGQYEEALQVYRANLARYPNNGWALHGMAECLAALGMPDEAADASRRFARAWRRSDISIPGSCFCRTGG